MKTSDRRARTVASLAGFGSLAVAATALAPALRAQDRPATPDPIAARLAAVQEREWARDIGVSPFLSDPSPVVRRAAARALGRIAAPGDEVAVENSAACATMLAVQLEDEKDAAVRREILLALGQAGTPEAAALLVKVRDAEAPAGKVAGVDEEKIAAATALRFAAGEPERAALVRGLAHGLPEVRRDSALALGVLERRRRQAGDATIDTATRAALLSELAAPIPHLERAPEATHAFVFALSAMGDPREEARGALARLLASGLTRPDTLAECARGLARSAKGDATEHAPPALLADFADGHVATEVVGALAKHTKDLAARRRLRELIKHPSFHARRAAATALGSSLVPALVNECERHEKWALVKAMGDAWETVRAAAFASIARRDPSTGIMLAGSLAREGVSGRLALAHGLGPLLDAPGQRDAARAILTRLLREDDDARVRAAALEALAAVGDGKEALGAVLAVASVESDPGLVSTALELLLGKLAAEPASEPAVAAVYSRVRSDRAHEDNREQLVAGLGEKANAPTPEGKLGPDGQRTLELAATDPSPVVAQAALKALVAHGLRPGPVPPRARPKPHDRPRDLAGKRASLLVETGRGDFTLELYPDEAPLHVANVLALAEKGFYDGLTWHRVVSNFVVQGGCPRGDGSGDPGWNVPDEVSARPYVRGTLGMPKGSRKDTGGCQLFFTHGRTPHLDGRYTVFGQIRAGFEVVDRLEEGDRILAVKVVLEAE